MTLKRSSRRVLDEILNSTINDSPQLGNKPLRSSVRVGKNSWWQGRDKESKGRGNQSRLGAGIKRVRRDGWQKRREKERGARGERRGKDKNKDKEEDKNYRSGSYIRRWDGLPVTSPLGAWQPHHSAEVVATYVRRAYIRRVLDYRMRELGLSYRHGQALLTKSRSPRWIRRVMHTVYRKQRK